MKSITRQTAGRIISALGIFDLAYFYYNTTLAVLTGGTFYLVWIIFLILGILNLWFGIGFMKE